MDLKDIRAIIDLMKKNSVSEFELEKQDFKIRLKRVPNGGGSATTPYDEPPAVAYGQPSMPLAPQVGVQQPAQIPAPSPELEIKSPMIGTFYRSPSPDAAPYVDVGVEVNPDTVVCIIEAMKVMNEIKAEAKGVISQVLVQNAKPVEFGQALFKLRPA